MSYYCLYNDTDFKYIFQQFKEINAIKSEEDARWFTGVTVLSANPNPYKGFKSSVEERTKNYDQEIVKLADKHEYSYIYEFLLWVTNRLNAKAAEYLYLDIKGFSTADNEKTFDFYALTQELRDVFVKYDNKMLTFLHRQTDFPDDMFGLVNESLEYSGVFYDTLYNSLRFLDWDLFKAYMEKYGKLDSYLELFRRYIRDSISKKPKFLDFLLNDIATPLIVNPNNQEIIQATNITQEELDDMYIIAYGGDMESIIGFISRLDPNLTYDSIVEMFIDTQVPSSFEQLFRDYETNNKYGEIEIRIKMDYYL